MVSATSPPIPTTIEPITGWRMWNLGWGPDGRLALLPLTRHGDDVWPARRAGESLCRGRGHARPRMHCSCGFYAVRDPQDLWSRVGGGCVIGTVSLWGRVIEHEWGYRAQYAYPSRIMLVCRRCLVLGLVRRCDRVLHTERLTLESVCSEHEPGGPIASVLPIPGREAQAALLGTYAVDVLPEDSVPPPPPPRFDAPESTRPRSGGRRRWPWVVALFVAFRMCSSSPDASEVPIPAPADAEVHETASLPEPVPDEEPAMVADDVWTETPGTKMEFPPLQVILESPRELWPDGVCGRLADGFVRQVPCWSRRAEVFVTKLAPARADPYGACGRSWVWSTRNGRRLVCWDELEES